MSKNDLPDDGPVEAEPLEIGDDLEGLADLIDDPDTDHVDDDDADQADDDETDDDVDLELDGDTDDEAAAEDDETDETDDNEDGPDDYSGGRFASYDAKVKLEDGQVITVKELARNNLYQRDYTAKTMEHSKNVKAFEEQREQFNQLENQVKQQQEYILWYAQNYMPPDPGQFQGDAATDPVGYNVHRQKQDAYEEQRKVLDYFTQQQALDQQRVMQEQEAANQKHLANELSLLRAKDPNTFGDDAKFKSFFDTAVQDAHEHYGLTDQEIYGITDHRMVLALKDALAYRRLKSKAPKAKEKLTGKPVLVKNGQRKSKASKKTSGAKARLDRLRKTGTIEDGAASLMDFDL